MPNWRTTSPSVWPPSWISSGSLTSINSRCPLTGLTAHEAVHKSKPNRPNVKNDALKVLFTINLVSHLQGKRRFEGIGLPSGSLWRDGLLYTLSRIGKRGGGVKGRGSVLSRLFTYWGEWCYVDIMVSDAPQEIGVRLASCLAFLEYLMEPVCGGLHRKGHHSHRLPWMKAQIWTQAFRPDWPG